MIKVLCEVNILGSVMVAFGKELLVRFTVHAPFVLYIHNILLIQMVILRVGKELLTRLTMCSLCILTICNFSYFSFPVLILRAGFWFCLLHFLVFAYFLLGYWIRSAWSNFIVLY